MKKDRLPHYLYDSNFFTSLLITFWYNYYANYYILLPKLGNCFREKKNYEILVSEYSE